MSRQGNGGPALEATGGDPRVTAVRRLLDRAGIPAEVSAAGKDRDIAAIRADIGLRPRLTGLAEEIRSHGFRYVALDAHEVIEENDGT